MELASARGDVERRIPSHQVITLLVCTGCMVCHYTCTCGINSTWKVHRYIWSTPWASSHQYCKYYQRMENPWRRELTLWHSVVLLGAAIPALPKSKGLKAEEFSVVIPLVGSSFCWSVQVSWHGRKPVEGTRTAAPPPHCLQPLWNRHPGFPSHSGATPPAAELSYAGTGSWCPFWNMQCTTGDMLKSFRYHSNNICRYSISVSSVLTSLCM